MDEAAHLLGMSPARVRQMLRSGELEGERREERIEGVLGPWRIPTEAVDALRERLHAEGAETTVVLPPGETLTDTVSEGSWRPPSERTAETPSEASELLSEGVRDLREKAEGLLEELQRLEGRLEAAEMQEIALREELRREKGRSGKLREELELERRARRA
ncbi:MAG TPA: helix-turn-helix domain-containing protein [Rubrobacteraceae bacterium]|nr:helix-turn-helix domain-containing protein [Rubrobacteraceae bacterium]